VISHTYLDPLISHIQALIEEGWQPLGGMQPMTLYGATCFYQTMVH
jgi:hypothetical protein